MEITTQDLESVKNGNRSPLLKIDAEKKRFQSIIISLGLSSEEAGDVFMDGIVSFYHSALNGTYDLYASKRKKMDIAFFTKLFKNQAISFLRKKKKFFRVSEEYGPSFLQEYTLQKIEDNNKAIYKEKWLQVKKTLKNDGACLALLLKKYLHNMSYQDIEEEGGYGTAKQANNRMTKCKEKIKKWNDS
jgi:DNA-directed RNA polymerase specialized sigma24 family protein